MSLSEYVTSVYEQESEREIVSRLNHSSNGLGYANEGIFNVTENNSNGPDLPFCNLELKASSVDSDTLMTICTNAPKINLMNEEGKKKKAATRFLVEGYAKQDDTCLERKNLYQTIKIGKTTNISGHEFSVTRSEENIWVTVDEKPIVGWKTETLVNAVSKKIGTALLLTKGKAELVDRASNSHRCKFTRATLYENFSAAAFISMLDAGKIVIDLRAHSMDVGKPSLKIRDHGTAFRVAEDDISGMFEITTECFRRT